MRQTMTDAEAYRRVSSRGSEHSIVQVTGPMPGKALESPARRCRALFEWQWLDARDQLAWELSELKYQLRREPRHKPSIRATTERVAWWRMVSQSLAALLDQQRPEATEVEP